ncbi:hypothetical protein VTJ83DRAFT_3804 [Remersonia thermophila]|uniref:BAR domain-containing protein n=1 Tax=Remersonia thermophila TaxID=72144 RepID=A0ABR4DF16_9PEZI
MNISKRFDRAFQWAGEKMGAEAKTNMSEDFKMLEAEMALRFDGMERLQRSMNQYVKWMGRRVEAAEDKDKPLPVGYLGRTMVSHGEEFQADSDYGNCLITMGRANERISSIQEAFVNEATATWLECLERSLATMKEYHAARKKLENRRLNYDACITKVQKAKRDDPRLEEELRNAKVKYEESTDDVLRRMQDIQDAEADNMQDLTRFLDAELEYHERCVEELRRARQNWPASASPRSYSPAESRPALRSQTSATQSIKERSYRPNSAELESTAPAVRMPVRANPRTQQPDGPTRPSIGRDNSGSFQGGAALDRERSRLSYIAPPAAAQAVPIDMSALRGQLRPVNRGVPARDDDVFGDRESDTASDSGSPDWSNHSVSSATSAGSLSHTPSHHASAGLGGGLVTGVKKAPPPPPPSRAKKPAPPVPARRF